MTPGSRKRASPPPDPVPVTLAPPGFVADRSEAAARVERLLQYQFHNRSLLEEALTHQSVADGAASYQRLEFVGDAALGLAFSNFLFLTNPTLGPGALSSLRAANVSTEKLARVAVRHDLYPLLRRNCPRLDLLVCSSLYSSPGFRSHGFDKLIRNALFLHMINKSISFDCLLERA
jgi:hypothetical protein